MLLGKQYEFLVKVQLQNKRDPFSRPITIQSSLLIGISRQVTLDEFAGIYGTRDDVLLVTLEGQGHSYTCPDSVPTNTEECPELQQRRGESNDFMLNS